MAWTQQQYDDLCAAIAEGARKVKYADKEVEFRSQREMLILKAQMEKELGIVEDVGPVRVTLSHDKGLDD